MVIDTSAIFAIVLREPEGSIYSDAIIEAAECSISTATTVEVSSVCLRRGLAWLEGDIERLLSTASVRVVPFTEEQSAIARSAYNRFGKGRHPAALNLGDTFSYALAMHLGEPLLFKGGDFALTDVVPAV